MTDEEETARGFRRPERETLELIAKLTRERDDALSRWLEDVEMLKRERDEARVAAADARTNAERGLRFAYKGTITTLEELGAQRDAAEALLLRIVNDELAISAARIHARAILRARGLLP